jgi:hypothetical protein
LPVERVTVIDGGYESGIVKSYVTSGATGSHGTRGCFIYTKSEFHGIGVKGRCLVQDFRNKVSDSREAEPISIGWAPSRNAHRPPRNPPRERGMRERGHQIRHRNFEINWLVI